MLTKRIGQVDRRRFAVDLPNSVTCGNRNETLKYPGRFHRDTERYFRKTGTIFEKNRFRQIWSIISRLYILWNFADKFRQNSIAVAKWYRRKLCDIKVVGSTLDDGVGFLVCARYLGFFVVKTSHFQNFNIQKSCSKCVGVWWVSICARSRSQVDSSTTWQYSMTPFSYLTQTKFGLLISIMYYRTKRFFSIF